MSGNDADNGAEEKRPEGQLEEKEVGDNAGANEEGDNDGTREEEEEGASGPSRKGREIDDCKLSIKNVNKHWNTKSMAKQLGKWGVEGVKKAIKVQGKDIAHVVFEAPEHATAALEKLKQAEGYKGRALDVFRSFKQSDDRFQAKKRPRENEEGGGGEGGHKRPRVVKSLADQVTPLHAMQYDEQVQHKHKLLDGVLHNIKKQLRKELSGGFPPWLERLERSDALCALERVVPSPVQDHYRNKCEFTIGFGEDDKPVVGFLMGGFREGVFTTHSPAQCKHVSPQGVSVASAIQQVVRASPLAPYNRHTHEGFWRLVTLRQNRKGELMVTLQVRTEGNNEQDMEPEFNKAVQALQALPEDVGKVVSVHKQVHNGVSNAAGPENTPSLVLGAECIVENMLGFDFRVSPSAFFQVNTPCAETLYSLVIDEALRPIHTEGDAQQGGEGGKEAKEEGKGEGKGVEVEVFLDVCCGTGTIGICASKRAKRVIGIEMVEQAVADAKANAELNQVRNCDFLCGKAEDVLKQSKVLQECSGRCVAVVDPPRSGLHQDVVRCLRACEAITRVVYVACSPKSIGSNVAGFCRLPSNRFQGTPFRPVKAIGVDLFPHTEQCEMVLVLERAVQDK